MAERVRTLGLHPQRLVCIQTLLLYLLCNLGQGTSLLRASVLSPVKWAHNSPASQGCWEESVSPQDEL